MKKQNIRIAALLAASMTGLVSLQAQTQVQHPFQNPDLPAEERIDNLLSLMTLDEKIACLGTYPAVPRLKVTATRHVEGLHGLAMGGPSNWGKRNPCPTTIFPQAIGLAESWDADVLKRAAEIESREVRFMFQNKKYARGGLVVRAPNADMGRDPRWGRTEECYGEDPFLNGALTAAFVKGLQGDHPRYWRTASLMKHFLANSNENGRDSTSSDFDERLWREYYAYPFWRGVADGGSRAYMAAYNAVNGVPCTVHPMLRKITADEWGQNGIICTDGGAFSLLVSKHRAFADRDAAAAACVNAGISQFLDWNYEGPVRRSLESGAVSAAALDSVLRGNFRVMIKLGMWDPHEMVPYASIGVSDTLEPWMSAPHRLAAREVAQKTIVLLKNAGGLLPLDASRLKSIAVIGRRANEVLLDWYSGTPPYVVPILQGITLRAGQKADVRYSGGDDIRSAATLARASDVAVVCVGNHPTCDAGWADCPLPSDGKEAVDRKSIDLEQEALVKAVLDANPKTVVVLVSSFPYAVKWTRDHVPAVLHMTHAGQESGNALADVLFGDVNPAGRLVQTWPESLDQLPPMMDYDIRHGRTYMYFRGEPVFPFGHGLSYTSFSYADLSVSDSVMTEGDSVFVRVKIRNTGRRAGEEVVQ
jgi:beta-glucosidase